MFHHLLDYSEAQGNEIYLEPISNWGEQLHGLTFGQAAFMFDGAVLLGVLAERLCHQPELETIGDDCGGGSGVPMVYCSTTPPGQDFPAPCVNAL